MCPVIFMLSPCSRGPSSLNSKRKAENMFIKIFHSDAEKITLCCEYVFFSLKEQTLHICINKFLFSSSIEIAAQKADVYVGFFQIKFPKAEPTLAQDQRN